MPLTSRQNGQDSPTVLICCFVKAGNEYRNAHIPISSILSQNWQ
ncbi:hypothetical protein [Treponema sp.]